MTGDARGRDGCCSAAGGLRHSRVVDLGGVVRLRQLTEALRIRAGRAARAWSCARSSTLSPRLPASARLLERVALDERGTDREPRDGVRDRRDDRLTSDRPS